MLLQRRKMETITNNITNVETTGFNKEFLVSHSFDQVMIRRINDAPPGFSGRNVGPMHLGTQVDQVYIDFSNGAFDGTERSTDFALQGDVFFVMQTPDGERFTRAGAFYLNHEGYLIDGRGNFLLGENGQINVGGLNFRVDTQGNVFNEAGLVDTIRFASFEDNQTLRPQGDNMFLATVPPLAAPHQFIIAQGFLENSNVDVGREMVDMITVFRAYETSQRMVQMIDETVGRAVNDIGRLR